VAHDNVARAGLTLSDACDSGIADSLRRVKINPAIVAEIRSSDMGTTGVANFVSARAILAVIPVFDQQDSFALQVDD